MAYTLSTIVNSYMGEFRMKQLRVTADAATQTVETGLGHVSIAIPTPVSGAVSVATLSGNTGVDQAAGWVTYVNSNASGVQSNGVLGISNAVSGDVYDIVVFGHD